MKGNMSEIMQDQKTPEEVKKERIEKMKPFWEAFSLSLLRLSVPATMVMMVVLIGKAQESLRDETFWLTFAGFWISIFANYQVEMAAQNRPAQSENPIVESRGRAHE